MRDPIRPHQQVGIEALLANPTFCLFDEPGVQKSRQVIEAANIFFEEGKIDLVLIICPAQLKFNWYDKDLGEIASWSIPSVECIDVGEDKRWGQIDPKAKYLLCSYEWLRIADHKHTHELMRLLEGKRYWLVADESSFLANRKTKQWREIQGPRYGRVQVKVGRAVRWQQLKTKASRCTILNGTPTGNSLLELWGQLQVCDKKILNCTYWEFFNRHAVRGGFMNKEVVAYRDLDGSVLQPNEVPVGLLDSIRPWVLCRSKRDKSVINLPYDQPDERTVTLNMTPALWQQYKKLRDDFILALEDKTFTPLQAGVHSLRLWQVLQGFITEKTTDPITLKDTVTPYYLDEQIKTNWLRDHLKLTDRPVLIWCWFQAQIDAVKKLMDELQIYALVNDGRTTRADKYEFLRFFHPRSDAPMLQPTVGIMQHAAGGFGVNLSRAAESIYLSCNASYKLREQVDGRIDRPGQTEAPLLTDVLLLGPKGQRTLDLTLMKSRQRREDFANWTKNRWRSELRD